MKIFKTGFTLTEMLVGLVVGAIVVLMVGAIGTIAFQSYNGLRKKSDVYNDSQSALQMIRESIRQSTAIPTVSSNSLTLVTPTCSNIHIYILNNDLLYESTCGGVVKPAAPIISAVTWPVSGLKTTVNDPLVTVALSGTKNGVTFNYSIDVTRRN